MSNTKAGTPAMNIAKGGQRINNNEKIAVNPTKDIPCFLALSIKFCLSCLAEISPL